MTQLVRNYLFTKQDKDVIGCVFDWFEVRVKGIPKLDELSKFGYSEELDNGCATHNHYFETDDFSVSWDIKSSYIAKVWSHLRIKNSVFYSLRGFNSVVEFVILTAQRLFNCDLDEIIISRLDFAFDMTVGSFWHNVLRGRFEKRDLEVRKYTQFHGRVIADVDSNIEEYTEFHGKVGRFEFTNYSAGSRSGQLFFRLYYKTIENTSYREHCAKKQYISDWHKMLFGDVQVVRFEVEYKPKGNHILTSDIYSLFGDFWERYACGVDCVLYLGESYAVNNRDTFTDKDRVKLVKLIRKFLNSDWDTNYSFSDYVDTLEEFTDILENVFNERL